MDRDWNAESEEVFKMASKINVGVIEQVRKEDPRQQSSLAMVSIGLLFGTAYATEFVRSGGDAAYDWAVKVLQLAEGVAHAAGAEISFTVVRKNEEKP